MEGDLEQFLADTWHDIAGFVNESAVYIDHAATECLHWYTGGKVYSFFKAAGAVSVHEQAMYNFRYIKVQNCKKVVIISTSINLTFYQRTVKMILEKNAFEHCTIITAAHSSVLNYDDTVSTEDRVDYAKLKRDVKSWMQSNQQLEDCSVTILFRPVFISLIDNGLFVTPPFSDLLSPLNSGSIKNSEYAVEHFVSLFNSLLTNLNLREDIYSMGKFSEYVAEKLETLPMAIERRNSLVGATGKGVSVIFVDRTLDLCTSTSNNTESLLAKILCTLSHLPHHCNDVAINMYPLFSGPQKFVDVPGCLASSDKTLMNILITKTQKEVLATANKMLIDILPTKENLKLREKLKPKPATRISAHSLKKLVNKFKDIDDLHTISESSKKLQVVLGIIQALTSEKTSRLELLISFEKLVLQNIAVSRDSTSVLGQLSSIIKTREKHKLHTDSILAFLVHIYALAGTEIQFSLQQEQQLEEAIADAVFEDIIKLKGNTMKTSMYEQSLSLLGVTDAETIKETSAKIAKHIMTILHEIAQQRASLHNYTSLMSKSSSQEIVRRVGILQQLLTDMLHPDRFELPDLHQRSPSFISAGLNLFSKGRIKHHPCDNNWIIIYVIGGVTPEEIRETKEIISLFNSNCQITIAGSRLLNPIDIVDKVLLSSIDY
ncbi:sec1 family domain-containing protein 2-like [Temnothorax curvispinosus]|uniref:Sec1 family domain-containing protein 2-like n=1 Tax=Temnothorax curvispinosus TaxID=300111 RepID=A0A6J1PXX3_9HYME|nr:sec1 family domain-containing protein 2-like [Temnothorax curvispinosus]XP_024874061.1 sec1 family domain-containing protein 2-like [Temnothorax curvispinosus]XP_024874063.1 sec1 family domain-containing protein 2-like [Temnothorax curvispinosus]XP_024874064.1 sec1 family domain-containing protein 2-like [Temnothorax curvispinosus]